MNVDGLEIIRFKIGQKTVLMSENDRDFVVVTDEVVSIGIPKKSAYAETKEKLSQWPPKFLKKLLALLKKEIAKGDRPELQQMHKAIEELLEGDAE